MRRRHALPIALAAVLGALALVALPALAGAKDRNHDRSEHRHHHRHHHRVIGGEENAGTISAFDAGTGRLTIALFGGDSVSGLVTAATEVKCEAADDSASASRHRGSSGSGEEEAGDDRGGRGEEEPGDDRGEAAEPGDDNDGNGIRCSTADLEPGAVVHEAELEVRDGVATFEEVELAHTS